LFVAAPVAVSWLSIAPEQQDLMAWLLRLSALIFSCGIIARAFGAVPMALQRYDISGRISIAQSVVRAAGYIALVMSGFGILHLVICDLVTQFVVLCVQIGIARAIFPALRAIPVLSMRGLREIFGYSAFSFLTFVFHAMYRESGKLTLGALVGPSPVAHFGTPDSVAYRIYMVVANSSETLMTRFSANRDTEAAQALILSATWASLALSVIFFVPLAALMPELLKLWIGSDFARESATVGQLVALAYIAPAAFAPIACFFRGTGRPWVVTVVMAAAGIVTLVFSAALVHRHGVAGVGYAYLLSSIPWLVGLAWGWIYAFGFTLIGAVIRAAVVPLSLGGVAFALAGATRDRVGDPSWFQLLALGGSFAAFTALLVFAADCALGKDGPSQKLLHRIVETGRLDAMLRFLHVRRAR
jgi:O-antigen/teichoic acid export membrane protein